jgi:2-keto-3-deoxy-L-rhamnonate aldolase RhmA
LEDQPFSVQEEKKMTARRFIALSAVLLLACVILGIQVRAQGGAAAPAAGAQGAPAGRGAGRGAGGAGGGAQAMSAKGTITPLSVDARGEGWMVKSYLEPAHLPLYNQAKQKLLDQKQVTSRTISRLDPEGYCEARKHWDFIWFEMQHSTMTWGDMEKMIAACPGMLNGMTGAPMIRMPNSLESDMQKGGDIGALGFIVPTIGDGALDASFVGGLRFARYPPVGRRSSGTGQYNSIWGGQNMRAPGTPLIAGAPAFSYADTINDNMLTVVMVETVESVIAINDIANTFGVDVVIEGNNDLSRFSGFGQNDDRYQDLRIKVHNAALKAGKFYGSAGSQYLTGNILSPDVRLVQDGPAWDGYVAQRGRGPAQPAEQTIGVPGDGTTPAAPGAAPGGGGGRGRRGGGAGAPAPATPAPAK